jgi:hypothetical protein
VGFKETLRVALNSNPCSKKLASKLPDGGTFGPVFFFWDGGNVPTFGPVFEPSTHPLTSSF